MTANEIKAVYSMGEVAQRYGFRPNRAGFIPCPFHPGDREPSLKIYDKDFYCFACGSHGDIFDFVMRMDQVPFSEAFQSLGGKYQKPTYSSRMAIYRSRKQQAMKHKEAERKRERRRLNNMLIDIYRAYLERSEPLSDVWTDCYNALQYQLYLHEELDKMETRW